MAALWILILLPIVLGILTYLLPKGFGKAAALVGAVVHAAIAFYLFSISKVESALVPLGGWAAPVGISLYIDRLSGALCALVSALTILLLVYNLHRHYTDRLFLMLLLMIEGLLYGIFLLDDMFSIFVLVEVSTMVVSLLIMYKRDSRSIYDGMIYLLINTFSMTFYLFGLAVLYKAAGTFSIARLATIIPQLDKSTLILPYSLIITSVCLKAALMPLFSWLPKAHGTPSAPSVVSALLSGLYVKTGIYLYIRLSGAFATMDTSGFFMAMGVITAIVGFVLAVCQSDIKLLLSYSTVSQLGLIMLAINMDGEYAYYGGVYHILNHAVFKTTLFLCAGVIIEEYKERDISKIKGVFRRMPVVSASAIAAILGITGAPLFNGSVSKYLIAHGAHRTITEGLLTLINLGTLLTFVKLSSIFFGGEHKKAKVPLNRTLILAVFSIICFIGGIFGAPIMNAIFDTSLDINTGEYLIKAVIFMLSLTAAVLIYRYVLPRLRRLTDKAADFDLGFNGIAISLVLFFAVLLGYLHLASVL